MSGGLGIPELLMMAVFLSVYVGLIGVPAAMICRRIGKPWWFGLFALVPLANIALLWFVATTPWSRSSHSRDVRHDDYSAVH
jgi:hypothetical protein